MYDDSVTDPFVRGASLLARLSPEGVPPPWESFADVAPVLGHSVGTAFGTIMDRSGLDLRTREITTVAVLAALGGCEPQVAFHVGAALRAGATAPEIIEALTQVSVYAGLPRALNAVAAARAIFADEGVSGAEEAPRAVVVAFLTAIARGDRVAAGALLDRDVVWTIPGRPGSAPFVGTWKGLRQVEEFARMLTAVVGLEDLHAEDPLPAGDTVFVPLRYVVRGPGRQSPNLGQAVLKFRVREARIVEVLVCGDVSDIPPMAAPECERRCEVPGQTAPESPSNPVVPRPDPRK